MIKFIQNYIKMFKVNRLMRKRKSSIVDNMIRNFPGFVYECYNNDGFTVKSVSYGVNRIMGYKVHELVGSEFLLFGKLIHPSDLFYVKQELQKSVNKGSRFSLIYRILTKNKSVKWVLNEGECVIQDERIIGVKGFITDITKRKNSEDSLKIVSAAVMHSLVSVIITDANGIIQYVNPKFTEVTGYSLQEVIGKNPKILKSGKHSDVFYDNLWDVISTGDEWKGEICNKNKDGELFWEIASISSVKNDEGIITQYVGVKEDITKLKEYERQNIMSDFSMNHIASAVIWITKEGDVKYVNKTACNMVGYSKEEILTKGICDIFPEYDLSSWHLLWNEID